MASLSGQVPTRNQNVQWREFGSETILLDASTGQFAQVNAIGLAIWDCIDGQRTVADIADHLASTFDASPEDVALDVEQFITSLQDLRLLSVRS